MKKQQVKPIIKILTLFFIFPSLGTEKFIYLLLPIKNVIFLINHLLLQSLVKNN